MKEYKEGNEAWKKFMEDKIDDLIYNVCYNEELTPDERMQILYIAFKLHEELVSCRDWDKKSLSFLFSGLEQ